MQNGKIHNTAADQETKKESVKDSLDDLANHATDYVGNMYKLQVLNLTKKATDVTANVAGGLISLIIGLFVLFFAGIALAIWLGELVKSPALGFLFVAVFFALIAVIFMAIRKKIVFPLWRNKIIRKLYE